MLGGQQFGGAVVMGLLLAGTAMAAAPAGCVPWTNRDVVRLSHTGLPAGVLRARLKTVKCVRFDLSVEALQALQKAGVAPAVVIEMIEMQQQQERELEKAAARLAAQTPAPVTAVPLAQVARRARRSMLSVKVWDDAGHAWSRMRGFWVSSSGLLVEYGDVPAAIHAAQVRGREGDVFDRVSLVESDQRRHVSVLRVEGAGLPALELAGGTDAPPGSRVYLVDGVQGAAALLAGRVGEAVHADEIEGAGRGYRLTPVKVPGVQPSRAVAGRPVLNREGEVVGVMTGYRQGSRLLMLPVTEIRGRIRDRLGRSLAPADPQIQGEVAAPVPHTPAEMLRQAATVYIWDRTRSGLEQRAMSELRKRGIWEVTGDAGTADLWLVIEASGRSWTRMESVEVYDRRSRTLLWSGDDHVAPFRRSAVRRLVDKLMRQVAEMKADGAGRARPAAEPGENPVQPQ